ncbi:ABC transporter substrate-binding protein [uncultured Rhodoferax sp.]|uniref:ABC transporter substrate-binding protein n=1 Tax=uncultured Rhodoferax sp. TaxID=223188 RepID=UPI0025D36454|nr:ABC transporter substrate-binding protein [uncultured Rhodoferax sp.]
MQWIASAAMAGPVSERVLARRSVRVCIWPEYYGVTYRHPQTRQLSGIDIELSRELGKDLDATIEYVESSFPSLIQDLRSDRCDVAMFAVGMLPQRLAALKFTKPYLHSDIYAITTRSHALVRQWSDIDQPDIRVGVQTGTFMEPVMKTTLKKATLVSISPPATREQELESGRIDVFMTDFPYSRRLLDNADWARLVSPPGVFHVLPYAYAVKPGDDDWLKSMDDFVTRIKRDGRLLRAANLYGLGEIVEH